MSSVEPRSAGVQNYNVACNNPECNINFKTLEDMHEHMATAHDDPVNHPKHYTSHPSGIECIEITRHMPFNEGNVVKYLWRAGQKENAPTLQDLQKAKWYLEDAIKMLEAQEKNA